MNSDRLTSDLESLRIHRDASPPRRGPKIVAGLLVLAGLVGAAWTFGKPWAEGKIFKTEVEITEIALVSPAHARIELTSTGYVVPQVQSKVGARIFARIAEVAVREGQRVAAGDLLIRLDDSDVKAQLVAARQQALAARARAENARASLVEIEQQARRERALADKGAAPPAVAEDLEIRARALREAVKAADAEVKAAQARVETLEANLQDTRILAPIDGVIVTRPPEAGEVVGPQNGPILTVADFSTLAVETDVPEARLHLVQIGQPAEIGLDAFPGRRYRGQVLEISPRVDRSKATVTVKVKFVDGAEGVLPDMSARVSFLEGEALDAQSVKEPTQVVVPGGAVTERAGAKVVFVVEGDRARMVPIQLGPPFGTGFVLESGPSPGTRVVKNPPPGLADGQKIKEKSE